MVFRWKGGLIVLLLLCSIIFYDNFVNVQNPTIPSIKGGLFFGVIFSLIFLASINFVEYKTKKGKHPYLKIILFSFIFWLVITLLIELFWGYKLVNFVPINEGEEGVGLLILLFFTPMYTGVIFLLFSLIPSLIFYKIKDNKKVQNILLYVGIALIIIIFILALIGRYMYKIEVYSLFNVP